MDTSQFVPRNVLDLDNIFSTAVWQYLTMEDILNFSVVSMKAQTLKISAPQAMQALVQNNPNITHDIKHVIVNDDTNTTIAGLRKSLYKRPPAKSVSEFFDVFQKYSFDISCFLQPMDTIYSPHQDLLLSSELEKFSFDEFDDFVSRHPNPRKRLSHKRGDSLFNSDIELIADAALSAESSNLNVLVSLALKS